MPNPTPISEKDLFLRIAKGDELAYTEVFHLYAPRLFPYILKITKNEQMAKEFLQETFLRLWLKRTDLNEVREPGSWLFRIAANISLSYLRTENVRNRLQDKVFEKMKPAAYEPVETVEGRDIELMIHKAVENLPPKRKEVYLLSREEGLSYLEIAERMGLSVNTVKNHLGMALKSIQENLRTQTGLSLSVLMIILSY